MKQRQEYSDEHINAFIDGELAAQERQALLAAAAESDPLRRRICEQSYLKELVREAWPLKDENVAVGESGFARRRFGLALAAAVALVSLSGLFGLLRHEGMIPAVEVSPGQGVARQLQSEVPQRYARVVFHISSADPEKAAQLLDQVELVLTSYARERRDIKVEVIANNEGLRMLQQGRSAVAARIQALNSRYANLTFAACGSTLARFRRERGEQIEILSEAVIVQSGVSFVARRQQEGWAYIKV